MSHQKCWVCSKSLFKSDPGYVKDIVKFVYLWIVHTSSEKLSNNLATIIMGFSKEYFTFLYFFKKCLLSCLFSASKEWKNAFYRKKKLAFAFYSIYPASYIMLFILKGTKRVDDNSNWFKKFRFRNIFREVLFLI